MGRVLAGLIAASVLGADVRGTWNAKVETDAGSGSPQVSGSVKGKVDLAGMAGGTFTAVTK